MNNGDNASFVNQSTVLETAIKPRQHNLTQEDREYIKAGYNIYHILHHRDKSIILVIDANENKIIKESEDFVCHHIPKNLLDLQNMVADSLLSNSTVLEVTMNS